MCVRMGIEATSIDAAETAGRKAGRNQASWYLPSLPMFDGYLIGQGNHDALATVCREACIEESGAKPTGVR